MTKNGTVEINKAAEQHANHRTQSVKTQLKHNIKYRAQITKKTENI